MDAVEIRVCVDERAVGRIERALSGIKETVGVEVEIDE
jgi:hypothetical protein